MHETTIRHHTLHNLSTQGSLITCLSEDRSGQNGGEITHDLEVSGGEKKRIIERRVIVRICILSSEIIDYNMRNFSLFQKSHGGRRGKTEIVVGSRLKERRIVLL
eukprot:Lithocolla_globosa_v1_NODE_1100_length_2870_cov_54.217052.p3 type:complete len:105 gc:universal NODE_1100_length_2870_cov_54.217052:2291-1977(-)